MVLGVGKMVMVVYHDPGVLGVGKMVMVVYHGPGGRGDGNDCVSWS